MGQLSRVTLFPPAQSLPGPDQLGPVTANHCVAGPWEPVPCPRDGRAASPPRGCEKTRGAGWVEGRGGRTYWSAWGPGTREQGSPPWLRYSRS